MKLDARLTSIAQQVPKGSVVADIGTDHAYLPIYLCLENIASHVYACDIAKMPLKKAKENIQKYHLEDKIEPILTDGLHQLSNHIDVIIIAGMGGHLMANIIQGSTYPMLILQPNTHAEIVRNALLENNYKIIEEEVVLENQKYYEIIKAIPGKENYTMLELQYGPILLQKKTPLFLEKYRKRYAQLKEILATFNQNEAILNELELLKMILE